MVRYGLVIELRDSIKFLKWKRYGSDKMLAKYKGQPPIRWKTTKGEKKQLNFNLETKKNCIPEN